MAEDFWAPVFERLLEDYEFLEMVANDTAENDLVAWIKPNRALFARCARFLKKNRVLDKPALAREMLVYARNDAALRKIILFTWVEKNSLTMGFPTLAVTAESESQLQSGKFGSPAKVRILARLDPRAGVKPLYERVLTVFAAESSGVADNDVVAATVETDGGAAIAKLEQRIAELEQMLDTFKTDNRQLKKQLETRQAEIVAQNRRIEEYSHQFKEAQDARLALKSELGGLRSRLDFLERQSAASCPASQPAARVDDSEQLAELSEEISALRRAVDNREATIRRLEGEKAELAARMAAGADKDRQILALRQRLAELAPSTQVLAARLLGYLLSSPGESSGRRNWLFLSMSGRVFFIDGALVSRTALVSDELCLLHLDAEERPVTLESLETDTRREICGCVETSGDELFLVADAQRWKVQVEIGENLVGVPVRGVWLAEFAERPAGIYRIEALAQQAQVAGVQKTVDLRQMKAFFRINHLNFSRFVELLRQRALEFNVAASGSSLTFPVDYHEIFESLRMQIRIHRYCASADCQSRAFAEIMACQTLPGQSCEFCGKIEPAMSAGKQMFSGQRVLIFGGDYVGSEYERVLSGHNLVIEWRSGFKNLKDLKSSLGQPDLIVVVVRQISHTLLRELMGTIAHHSLPVLYSTRRGVSGILSDLTVYFSGDRL